MGRELKRVALDFDWPLETVWPGFLNPHYSKSRTCEACGGTGDTTARRRLGDLVSLLMLSGSDAMRGECHPYFRQTSLYNTNGKTCGADMAELTSALAGRPPSFMGHDSIDKWSATKKVIAAAGLPKEWGTCAACNGEGAIWESKEAKSAAEAWESEEPPAGPGLQIWETVSEGSPISPVFQTAEGLAEYMAGRAWGADDGTSYEQWLAFIRGPGWSPSLIGDANGLRPGVQASPTATGTTESTKA